MQLAPIINAENIEEEVFGEDSYFCIDNLFDEKLYVPTEEELLIEMLK